jgi:hypothetical protein
VARPAVSSPEVCPTPALRSAPCAAPWHRTGRCRTNLNSCCHPVREREGQLMAGTSQSGVQVARRKPVIQGGSAGKILSGSPGSGYGRGLPQADWPHTCPSSLGGGAAKVGPAQQSGVDRLLSGRAANSRSRPGAVADERRLPGEPMAQQTSVAIGSAFAWSMVVQ